MARRRSSSSICLRAVMSWKKPTLPTSLPSSKEKSGGKADGYVPVGGPFYLHLQALPAAPWPPFAVGVEQLFDLAGQLGRTIDLGNGHLAQNLVAELNPVRFSAAVIEDDDHPFSINRDDAVGAGLNQVFSKNWLLASI